MTLSRATLAIFAVTLLSVGCAPGIRVVKNPDDRDKGIRYYRPKPYLFLSPAGDTAVDAKGNRKITPSDQFVNVDLRYMPDFAEEYSISVNPGLGSANVNIGLEDGWNLTSINQELDTQFDENLQAVAALTNAVGGLVGTSSNDGRVGDSEVVAQKVSARNVPLGFYESVIGYDNCGRKQLYGWRYIGFTPFAPCPTYATGCRNASCQDGTLDLYGLVFHNGVMTFRRLNEVEFVPQEDRIARTVVVTPKESGNEPSGAVVAKSFDAVKGTLQDELRNRSGDNELAIRLFTEPESGISFIGISSNANIDLVTVAQSLLYELGGPKLGVVVNPDVQAIDQPQSSSVVLPPRDNSVGRVQIGRSGG